MRKSGKNNDKGKETNKAVTRNPSPSSMKGCPKDGVVVSSIKHDYHMVNDVPIYKHYTKDLPYNRYLKERARKLRKARNLSEVLFWMQVHKGKFWEIDFDRQRIIGNYIVDFYIKSLSLIIEIDGSSHIGKEVYDAKRQAYLESFGLKFYRIEDARVKNDLYSVMEELEEFIIHEYATPRPSDTPLLEGNNT